MEEQYSEEGIKLNTVQISLLRHAIWGMEMLLWKLLQHELNKKNGSGHNGSKCRDNSDGHETVQLATLTKLNYTVPSRYRSGREINLLSDGVNTLALLYPLFDELKQLINKVSITSNY